MFSKKSIPNNALGINTITEILRAKKDMVCELDCCKKKISENSLYMQHDYMQPILNIKVETTLCRECAKAVFSERIKKIRSLYKELTKDFITEIQISFIPDDIEEEEEEEEDTDIEDEPRNSDNDYMDYINREIQIMQNRA